MLQKQVCNFGVPALVHAVDAPCSDRRICPNGSFHQCLIIVWTIWFNMSAHGPWIGFT